MRCCISQRQSHWCISQREEKEETIWTRSRGEEQQAARWVNQRWRGPQRGGFQLVLLLILLSVQGCRRPRVPVRVCAQPRVSVCVVLLFLGEGLCVR